MNLFTKSSDTEEWFDLIFNRPLGLLWARFFNHFGVHPNTVTVLSILLGVAAAVCFVFPSETTNGMIINLVGILLFTWADIYDSADGQLARMSGKFTQLGRILDGAASDIWFFCVYFAVALRLTLHPATPYQTGWLHILPWLLCLASGICHIYQCRFADYYRNIHLHFLTGSSLDRSDDMRQQYQQLSWDEACIEKFFLWFYVHYTSAQESSTPQFQQFWHHLRRMGTNVRSVALVEIFLQGSRPLMKYTNILTHNTRAFALYVALLTNRPWLYPLFEIIVLTIILIYMRHRHETLSRRLTALQ